MVIILLALVVLIGVLSVVGLLQQGRASGWLDDTRRVGDEPEVDAREAAERALSKNSAMRPGGGTF